MPNHDITYSGQAELVLPDTMKLLSQEYGITHAQFKRNGMKVAIVPCGEGGSLMMRRICEGGSRLETEKTAGVSHVLEHADFRSADWLKFGGIDKNASTSKLYIEHQAYMLLDPAANHLETELSFQADTMRGTNLKNLAGVDIMREVNNVKDEGLFNAQRGSYARNMIMKMEELLLPRVWEGGWAHPTIGLDHGQRISINKAEELVRLHHKFRGPSRTTLVLAGPVDTNKALQLASDYFDDIAPNEGLLDLPGTRAPAESGFTCGNVSTNGGTRGIALGFIAPPYGPDAEVLSLMTHLVGLLGSQPAVKQYGLSDVSMYQPSDKNASVVTILAKVSMQDPNEENAMCQAQQAIEQFIIAPLRNFRDDATLRELQRQAAVMTDEALKSGPQAAAALAIRGILAADKPALAWYPPQRITASRVRAVANAVFNEEQMGIVRATERDRSVGLARKSPRNALTISLMGSMPAPRAHQPPFPTTYDTSHLQLVARAVPYPKYLATPPSICTQELRNGGLISYNASPVLPKTKKRLTAVFGNTTQFGGWASAALVTAAMNTIAKSTNAGACKYKLSSGHVTATVQKNAAMQAGAKYIQPLVHSVAMASAVARGYHGTEQMREALPKAALAEAVEIARDNYDDVTYQAQALTRSKLCSPGEPGYVPQDFGQALEQLYDQHTRVVSLLNVLTSATPRLAGTNATYSNLEGVSAMLQQVAQQSAPTLPVKLQPVRHAPDLTANAAVSGLRTFPVVAAVKAKQPLLNAQDRAALILSNQIMVGGMGAVYTHDLRQRGVSYRPSGGIKLSWQSMPVLTLNATFDEVDRETGTKRTSEMLKKWQQGDQHAFSQDHIDAAAQSIKEQVRLRSYDYEAIEFDLLARLDPAKLDADTFLKQLDAVQNEGPSYLGDRLKYYFGAGKEVRSTVHAA